MRKRFWITVLFTSLCALLFAACDIAVKYEITVQGVQNGVITLSKTEAAAGETVTVTCIPDEGYALKEGSVTVNGEPLEGNSFTMPEEDVAVTCQFISTNYLGTYAYSATGNGWARIYDFIQINEETLTAGVTQEDFDFAIYEAPYEVNNFVLTATVSGEVWTVEIGNGVVRKGDREYTLTAELSLEGVTYTELQEQNGNQPGHVRDYAFSNDGRLICTTYLFSNGTTIEEEMTYSLYGSFLYIEEPDDVNTYNRKRYGVLAEREYGFAFLHNWFWIQFYGDRAIAGYNCEDIYPKREEITLKEDGAYILKERVNNYSGTLWDAPECYDFLSMKNGKLAFSHHGVNYDGRLHFISTDTEHERVGTALQVRYTLDEHDYSFVFHIINEDTIYLQSSMNMVEKYVFVKDVAFERAYGEPFTNTESLTEVSAYYVDGVYGDMYYDKKTGEKVRTEPRSMYQIFGNLIVSQPINPALSPVKFDIAEVVEQDPETSENGCDYKIYTTTVWYNDTCDGKSDAGIRFWKKLKGWELTQ